MAAISVYSKIHRHFARIPRDQLVASRDLLIHGDRGGVDVAVCNLIKDGVIWRVARGVFIGVGGRWPSVEDIAVFKARAFGREIRKHGRDTAVKFRIESEPNEHPTFYIDAGTTPFNHKHGRIFFRGVSKKRIYFEDTPAGLAIRALWSRGGGKSLAERYYKSPDALESQPSGY